MTIAEDKLLRLAVALGSAGVGGPLSRAEKALVAQVSTLPAPMADDVTQARKAIRAGEDPLGDRFCELRDAATRRGDGAVYTPEALVEPMVSWALAQDPARVIDAGAGSGRFVGAVIRQRPDLPVVAVDLDPVATLMTRATLSALDATHSRVLQSNYTNLTLPTVDGRTAFIGNPPYVRHHQLTPAMKEWAQATAAALGHRVSGLAGLHAYFFLATAVLGRPGDVGCFVTSAEWLDVNYGAIMRNLVLQQLGGESLHVVEPTAQPFEGTQTTAVITAFKVGEQPETIRMHSVESIEGLQDLADAGRPVTRARLQEAPRWSGLLRAAEKVPEGLVELGELCRVHRGSVTGANATFVLERGSDLPESVLYPSITKARELFAAGAVLADASALRVVVDIPTDLDILDAHERKNVDRFIKEAKRAGVHKGYIASHRRAWWSVGLKTPAPILATYMARQTPAFVLNTAEARHINIAHGLYPRQPLNEHTLTRLALALRTGVRLAQGRVYAGGLTKFEPKEMERLLVPDLATLQGYGPLTPALDAAAV